MSAQDDLNTWLKDPEFAVEYWKMRFRLANRESMKYENWVRYLLLDPSQAEHNSDIKKFNEDHLRAEYERGESIITNELFERLYPERPQCG